MTKHELKKVEEHELITESINTYARLLVNHYAKMGVKQLEKHWSDCCDEMIKRGIITKEDVDYLNR